MNDPAGWVSLLRRSLFDPEYFVELQAEAPFGIREAKCHGGSGIFLAERSVHRLEEEVFELQLLVMIGRDGCLWIDEFQLVAPSLT
jgi:hypothetical protein